MTMAHDDVWIIIDWNAFDDFVDNALIGSGFLGVDDFDTRFDLIESLDITIDVISIRGVGHEFNFDFVVLWEIWALVWPHFGRGG